MRKEIPKLDNVDVRYYEPKSKGKFDNIAIVFIGGSEGGFPKLFNIHHYRKQGIACLSLSYFKSKNTGNQLDKIDLGNLKEAIDKYRKYYRLEQRKLLVFGYSKGAELTLMLGSLFRDIRGVFLINPSDTVFQSPGSLIAGEKSSSWVFRGAELPYVSLSQEIFNTCRGKRYRKLYQNAIESYGDVNSVIEVENIHGPILIATGKEDIVWPSAVMGERIIKRLKEKDFPFWVKHISYEDGGHTLNPLYSLGGSWKGNFKANRDMKKQIMCLLDEVMKL